MKLYFKNKNNLTLEQLKIKYALDAYDITLDEGMLCIRINNVYPGNLSAKYTIVINGANGTISGDICPMAYVRKGSSEFRYKAAEFMQGNVPVQ